MFRDFRRNIASLRHGSPVQQGPWSFRLHLWEKYGTFSHRKALGIMTQTIENRVVSRIYGHGRGWAFSPVDFRDFGRVDMPLQRLERARRIRRVLRGIYDYPRFSELLQEDLSPDIHQVALAIQRKFGWRIQPDSAAALNLLGLSTQVPSQFTYQSDGPDRTYQVGKTKLLFKHTVPKEMAFRHAESGVIVHALKGIGQDRIDDQIIEQISNWLPIPKRAKVLNDTERVTDWVYRAIQRICKE